MLSLIRGLCPPARGDEAGQRSVVINAEKEPAASEFANEATPRPIPDVGGSRLRSTKRSSPCVARRRRAASSRSARDRRRMLSMVQSTRLATPSDLAPSPSRQIATSHGCAWRTASQLRGGHERRPSEELFEAFRHHHNHLRYPDAACIPWVVRPRPLEFESSRPGVLDRPRCHTRGAP
jgi:hypothetical protein